MNIGFDGKRAANNLTGLGNYSRSLILPLSTFFRQNQYLVYSPKAKSSPQINSFFQHENIHLRLPEKKTVAAWWRSFGLKTLLQKDGIDIYHGLSNEIPFGLLGSGIKTVVTIHDLIFLRLPGHYRWIDRVIYNMKSKYACRHADLIIAISERTRLDIIEYYQIPASKIKVIYQTCDDVFKKQSDDFDLNLIHQKYKLPNQYILSVGTIEPRKNLKTLITALSQLPDDMKLVVIGKKKPYAEEVQAEINRLGLQDRVIFLKDVPFEDLPLIYQLAKVFVYPSIYEGFGIPIIEALYRGVPVVAATGSCLEEAGGPGSLYVPPYDAMAMAQAVSSILENPEIASTMRKEGLKYVRKFETSQLSAQLMDCYTTLQKSK